MARPGSHPWACEPGPCVPWHPWGLALLRELGWSGFFPCSVPDINFWEVGTRAQRLQLVIGLEAAGS